MHGWWFESTRSHVFDREVSQEVRKTGGDSLNTRKNQDESIVVLLKTVPESEEIAFNRART